MAKFPALRKRIYILIVLLGTLTYCWTLSFPLVFDDLTYLRDNPLLRDWRSFLFPVEFQEFAVRPLQLGVPSDLSVNFILRPFCYLTFHLTTYRMVSIPADTGL